MTFEIDGDEADYLDKLDTTIDECPRCGADTLGQITLLLYAAGLVLEEEWAFNMAAERKSHCNDDFFVYIHETDQ